VHFYTVLGVLLALAAFGSGMSGAFARERSSQKMGTFMAVLLTVAAIACLVLDRMAS
jgi:hypothetical protein